MESMEYIYCKYKYSLVLTDVNAEDPREKNWYSSGNKNP